MKIDEIKASNKEIQKEIAKLSEIISNNENMHYYKKPGYPYEERYFEKYGIDIEYYISVFKKHNFHVWGKEALLNESHSKEEDIVNYAGSCLTFISFFIITDEIDTSTKSILNTIFFNDFPLLVNLNKQYDCLFKELFKSNNEALNKYKNHFINSFFEMIEQPTTEEPDRKVDFLFFWLTFNLHLIIRSDLLSQSLQSIDSKDTRLGVSYLNMFFNHFRKLNLSLPQYHNHWIRGIVRQINLKHDLIKKSEQEKDINLQKVSFKLLNIHSRKGGVGKSTFAILIARELLKKIKGVCLVDFDNHGPALEAYLRTRTKIEKKEDHSFLTEYFLGNIKTNNLSKCYRKIVFNGIENNLTLISMSERAGDVDAFEWYFRKDPKRLFSDFEKKLKILLAELQEKFDYVLIDTHPGLYGVSQEIMKISYQLNGELVFLVSPTFMDIIGYAMEIDNLKDLAGFKERFTFIMNKIHPEFYKKLKEDPSSLEPIVLNHIKNFPSSVNDKLYADSCIKKLSGFFKELNNLKFASVQEHEVLRHFYDIKIEKDSGFRTLDKLEDLKDLNELIVEIVNKISEQV